ncbi:MAG: 1-acyl-sn-glycerol-3-phosphate acyltransferase, partial [Clostridia bacterium]|nr:1-acyl-sn-glycerol-3-phosphate acyltransferase [Clostridia bacterium]
MKVKMKSKSSEEVMAIETPKHQKPPKPWFLLRTLVRVLSQFDMWRTRFRYKWVDKENCPEGPYLILMNHSSFLDLKIASRILYPMPYHIVSTSDSLIGKEWLMRHIGCIPTEK